MPCFAVELGDAGIIRLIGLLVFASLFVSPTFSESKELCRRLESVFIEKDAAFDDYRVYVEEDKQHAKLKVFKEETKAFATAIGAWHFTDIRALADVAIYIKDVRAIADITNLLH